MSQGNKAVDLPRWDLSDFYDGRNDAALSKDLDKAMAGAKDFQTTYKGKLADLDGRAFGKAIARVEELDELAGKIGTYAYLLRSTNLHQPEVMSFYQDVTEKLTAIGAETLFFGLELNKLSDDNIAAKMTAPETAHYRSYIENERVFKPYQLSDDVEEILHEKSVTGRSAWVRLFDETMASLRYEVDGKKLTDAEVMALLQSSDPEVRHKAGAALGQTTRENLSLLSMITNVLSKDKEIMDRKRGYESSIASRNLANQVEDDVVDALVQTVRNNYAPIAHRYYAMKAKWLGMEALTYWDRNAPLPDGEERVYTYEEAKDIVLTAYRAFSPKLAEIVQRFFDNGWIDVPVQEGKEFGAYAHPSVPSVHPYIMLNFQGKPRDVMTLAHELGHGVHQVLAAQQGYYQSHTPLTLAETASVFGEMLTFRSLLKQEDDPDKRFILLAEKTEDMLNTVIRQIAFHCFEQKLHERRKQGEVGTEEIAAFWQETQQEALGEAVELDEEAKLMWAQVPHFVHSPFYVYAYAFGDCLVNSLYGVYEAEQKAGKTGFADTYLAMLEKGGTEKHKEMLAPFGLDASDPAFWQEGLSVVSGMVDALEGLSQALGKTE